MNEKSEIAKNSLENSTELIDSIAQLKRIGLTDQLDFEAIRAMCKPEIIEELPRWKQRDSRGEAFADYVFGTYWYKPDSLPIVFVGGAHIPALVDRADKFGYHPLITSSLSRENLEASRSTLENPHLKGHQFGLGSVLGKSEYYGLPGKKFAGTQPLILIGDTHGASYEITLPSMETLRQLGVTKVAVFMEDEKKGAITLDKIRGGFAGKQQLAQVLEQYLEAGITVAISGIEDEVYFNRRLKGKIRTLLGGGRLDSKSSISESGAAEDVSWKRLAIERGMSEKDIPDPKKWLEQQISKYEQWGEKFTSTTQTYRNALKRLLEE